MFVLGDTITPLLAANFIYLFFLNAVIGVIEGKLLKRWFHGGRRAVWWMIPANYLSAWIGWLGVDWVLVSGGIEHYLGPRPIERINGLALLLVLVSFAVTLVLESGFVLVATERARRSFAQTVLASLSVNACSYLIICALFLCLSFTLPFNARITRLGNMAPLPPGTLYWVNPEGCVMVAASDHAGFPRSIGRVTKNELFNPY